MDIKGFKDREGNVHQYDYNALSNNPENSGTAIELADMVGYKIAPTGTILEQSDSNHLVSEPIPVNAGDRLLLTCSARFGNSLYCFYGTADNLVDNRTAPATDSGEGVEDLAVEVPAGAVTLRVAWNKLVTDVRYAVAKVQNDAQKRPLDGKKVALLGDSTLEKNNTATVKFVDHLAAETGATIENMGIGGAGFMQRADESLAHYQTAERIPEDADRIIIFGSGNDRDLPLGDPTDTGTDTVCGCINTTIDVVYERVPAAWVGLISPAPWQHYPPHQAGNAMEQIADAMAAICRRRGVPFMDLYHSSGLHPWDDAFLALAYSEADGVHPNNIGHAMIAPQIQAFVLGAAHSSVDVERIASHAAQMVDVPTDNHINALIYDALGVIENGTY